MRLFIRIVETGKITEAARSLGLSQPSASRCLKHLETLLDTRLLQRSSRGLHLTSNGKTFFTHACRVLHEWNIAVETTKADRQVLEGHVRIAAPIAIGQTLLASIAARFILEHPKISIDWELRDDAVDLTAGDHDLWVRAGAIHADDLVVRSIYDVQRAIVTAPPNEVVQHPRDLLTRSAVRLSTFVPNAIELRDGNGDIFVLDQKSSFTTDNIYAAQAAVIEGLGYAILPLWLVQPDLKRGTLTRTCRAWRPPNVTLSLAYLPNPRRPARIDAFAEHLRAELTSESGLGITFLESLHARDSVAIASAEPPTYGRKDRSRDQNQGTR